MFSVNFTIAKLTSFITFGYSYLCPFVQLLPQIIYTSTTCFPEYLTTIKVTKIYRITNALNIYNKIIPRNSKYTSYYIEGACMTELIRFISK